MPQGRSGSSFNVDPPTVEAIEEAKHRVDVWVYSYILVRILMNIKNSVLYTGYISRWFNFHEFCESLIAKIFTLIHVYLH